MLLRGAREPSISAARVSASARARSSARFPFATDSSDESATAIGAAIATATVLNGFGTCVRSQLFADQNREAST